MITLMQFFRIILSLSWLLGFIFVATNSLGQIQQINSKIAYALLANDMQLLVIQEPELPITQIGLAVRGGASAQNENLIGVPYILENLIFLPNYYYPTREQYEKAVNALNCKIQTQTMPEYQYFGLTLPAKQTAAGLEFINHCVRFPKFDTTELKNALFQKAKIYESEPLNPLTQLTNEIAKTLWKKEYPRKLSAPEYSHLRNATIYKLHSFHTRYFRPANSLIVMVGPLQPQRAVAIADSILANWEMESEPLPAAPAIEPLQKDTVITLIQEDIPNAILKFAWQLPSLKENPRLRAEAILFSKLLQLKDGQFYQQTLNSGLILDCLPQFHPSAYRSEYNLTLIPDPARITEALDTVRRLFNRMVTTRFFSPYELKMAQQMAESELIIEEHNLANIGVNLSQWWAISGIQSYNDFLNILWNVKLEDIQNFILKHCVHNYYVLGIAINSQQYTENRLKEYIEKGFPLRWVNPSLSSTSQTKITPDKALNLLKGISSSQIANMLAELPDTTLINVFKNIPDKRIASVFNQLPESFLTTFFTNLANQKLGKEMQSQNPDSLQSVTNLAAALSAYYDILLPPDTVSINSPSQNQWDFSKYRVYFVGNSLKMDAKSQEVVQKIAEIMYEFPDLILYVNGHTIKGNAEENQPIYSLEMARTIKKHLVKYYRIRSDRVFIRGYGYTQPEFPNVDGQVNKKNKRVTFSVR